MINQESLYIDSKGQWQFRDNFYVFKFKNKGVGFVVIAAPDAQLATQKAWKYDSDLTFSGSIDEFIELLKGGKIWDIIQQQDAESTERGK